MPVPMSKTSSVPESSVSSNDALFAPVLVAWKVTWTLHEPLGGRGAPGQVLEFSGKSAASDPTTVSLLTLTLPAVLLVNVNVWLGPPPL